MLSAQRFEDLEQLKQAQSQNQKGSLFQCIDSGSGLDSTLESTEGVGSLKKLASVAGALLSGSGEGLLGSPVLRERIRRYSWEAETPDQGELKELVRAQLYVQLIDRQRFPLKMVKLGQYVQVGPLSSKRYIEADILILDHPRKKGLVFAVEPLEQFEENLELRVGEMFDLAASFQESPTPIKKLVYFSRGFRGDFLKEQVRVIDFVRYSSFKEWEKAGKPTRKRLPRFPKSETGKKS